MKFGLAMFPTDEAIGPAELARAAEERGFECLLFPEHTHIPSKRQTPWPGGGDVPREYLRGLDPFVALGAAATATRTLKIGTGVCLVIERDPIVMAKEVASVDHISGGRVLFGVGGGWNREEMANHGTDYAKRWRVLRERVEAMKAIWTQEKASYEGEFVHFEEIWCWPKPAQKPHPPVLVGGDGAGTLERVVRYGEEWMPLPRGDADYTDKIRRLNEMAAAAGRDPIPVSMFAVPPKPEAIERHARAGAVRIIFYLSPAPADEMLPRLDRLAELARRFA